MDKDTFDKKYGCVGLLIIAALTIATIAFSFRDCHATLICGSLLFASGLIFFKKESDSICVVSATSGLVFLFTMSGQNSILENELENHCAYVCSGKVVGQHTGKSFSKNTNIYRCYLEIYAKTIRGNYDSLDVFVSHDRYYNQNSKDSYVLLATPFYDINSPKVLKFNIEEDEIKLFENGGFIKGIQNLNNPDFDSASGKNLREKYQTSFANFVMNHHWMITIIAGILAIIGYFTFFKGTTAIVVSYFAFEIFLQWYFQTFDLTIVGLALMIISIFMKLCDKLR